MQKLIIIFYDVATLKLTPLRIANIPPPMSFRDVTLESTPVDVAISPNGCRIAVLRGTCIDLVTWKFEKQKLVSGPELSPKIVELDPSRSFRQISFLNEETLGVIYDVSDNSVLQTISVPYSGPAEPTNTLKLPDNFSIVRLGAIPEIGCFWYEDYAGNVLLYNPQDSSESHICKLPAICPWAEVALVGDNVGTRLVDKLAQILTLSVRCLWALSKWSALRQRQANCTKLHIVRCYTSSSNLYNHSTLFKICSSPRGCQRYDSHSIDFRHDASNPNM